MPHHQAHRGRHPDDAALFAPSCLPTLREAARDLAYLVTRGYTERAALKLVGDRFQLARRQRMALLRVVCSDNSLDCRRAHEVPPGRCAGRMLAVDGYNVLIAVESALSGGMLFRGRDGCIRDIASIHGSYRRVAETLPALQLLGQTLSAVHPAAVTLYFDAPVSNSGRLAALAFDEAKRHGWTWRVEAVHNPDRALIDGDAVAVTSDGIVLDHVEHWLNPMPHILQRIDPPPGVVDLWEQE